MKIVLATGNPGKAREIAALFAELDIAVVQQAEFNLESARETGSTFLENALLKARFAAGKSGLPAMADDSGLVVDALDGRPGIYSARYASVDASDDANLDKLLLELEEVPETDRGAGFHCAAAVVFPDAGDKPLVAEGIWRGRILRSRKGAGGFGYDPVFYDPILAKTGAQMSAAEKNAISHRGKAFNAIKQQLLEWQGRP